MVTLTSVGKVSVLIIGILTSIIMLSKQLTIKNTSHIRIDAVEFTIFGNSFYLKKTCLTISSPSTAGCYCYIVVNHSYGWAGATIPLIAEIVSLEASYDSPIRWNPIVLTSIARRKGQISTLWWVWLNCKTKVYAKTANNLTCSGFLPPTLTVVFWKMSFVE